MSEPESKIVTAAPHNPALASTQLASYLGIEKGMMIQTVKRQCFKGLNPDQVTDEQLASFISVASQFKVNVMLPGFLYCYPERNGGIQVMIGPDLMFKLLSEHPEIESWETLAYPEDVALPPTHAITRIWRKGCERPVTYTAVLSEWRVQSNPNWVTRPRHMLSIRSLKQAARQLIHGLPFDEDERQIAEMQNVTGSADEAPKKERPKAPPREAKGVASVTENVKAKPTGTVIDAETTPVESSAGSAQTQRLTPAEAAAIEAEAGKAIAEAGKPLPDAASPAAKAAHATALPRAFLKDAEEITAICEVVKLDTLNINMANGLTPSVFAVLKGGYVGEAFHVGGATKTGTKQAGDKTVDVIEPSAPWAVGATLTLKLRGKQNAKFKNKDGTVGKLQVFVDSAVAEEGVMEV